MENDYWVGSNKPVFQTRLFWLSLLLPLLLGTIIGATIAISDNLSLDLFGGRKAIDLFWDYMKVPVAIMSLTIPFTSWVIANHRSAELVDTIAKQEQKRLSDLFYADAEYFVKTFGRFIKTHLWQFIEVEDLYLIHRQLYFHNLEYCGSKFIPNKIVLEDLKHCIQGGNAALSKFIAEFQNGTDTGNEKVLDHLCMSFYHYLFKSLNQLALNLGSRPILNNESVVVLLSALGEVANLYAWINESHDSDREFAKELIEKANTIAHMIMQHFGLFQAEEMTPQRFDALIAIREFKSGR
jgi:hypothetical protein